MKDCINYDNGCCKAEEARWGFPYKCVNEDHKDCVEYEPTWKNISEELPRKGTQCEIITKYNRTLIATYCCCNDIDVFRGEDVYYTIDDVIKWRLAPIKED